MEKRIKKDARKDVDGPQDAYRSRRVVGSHVEGPAVFYFANNRRALCFRHCQADSNARTKVIMKRYLFKCIGAWCHPRRSLLNLSLYIYIQTSTHSYSVFFYSSTTFTKPFFSFPSNCLLKAVWVPSPTFHTVLSFLKGTGL